MLLTFMAMSLVIGAYSEGFDRLWRAHLLSDFTLPALGALNPVVWFGIISMVSRLLSALLTEIARRRLNLARQPLVARALWLFYGLTVAALLIFALTDDFGIALVALWVASAMRDTAEPILSTWTNQHVDSKVRATVLSSLGQVNAMGQIGGGPVVGLIGNSLGLRAALSASALLLTPILWLIARAAGRQTVVEVEPSAT